MRGEYFNSIFGVNVYLGSPPLARGILLVGSVHISDIGITPACAGNTSRSCFGLATARDHPRLRGEYIQLSAYPDLFPGSPPLARGILITNDSNWRITGITPACAGNTISKETIFQINGDHPRLRGEYPLIN